MSKGTNIAYGLLLVLLVVDIWKFNILPTQFIPYALVIIGGMILFTPLASSVPGSLPAMATGRRDTFVNIVMRRIIFGLYLIFVGVLDALTDLGINLLDLPYISIRSLSGQWIILGIAVIYFLAVISRARTMQVQSV